MKREDFNRKAPYYFKDISKVLRKDGTLRQSKKVVKLIKKHYSDKYVISGYPIYCLRVDHYQFKQFDPCVLCAVPDLKGGFEVKFME